MAAVLYEPAFIVLAKHFPEPAERRRAMTAMTLVAALASFIFLPLSQALIDAHGWRDALLVLAVDPRRRHRPAARARAAAARRRRRATRRRPSARPARRDALRSRAVLAAVGRVLARHAVTASR